MSRYYVFTEGQLETALQQWVAEDDLLSRSVATSQVVRFLNSRVCEEMGMARDLPDAAAPEMKVALDPASLPEPTL